MFASRRTFLSALASCAVPAVARARVDESRDEQTPEGFAVHELTFDRADHTMQRARVYVPHDLTPDQKWPVAILLHGYAQALADERALSAWGSEYDALGAYRSLAHGAVRATAALGIPRSQAIEQGLRAAPFRGMVLVAPVTPIPYFQRNLAQALTGYADWMHHELLPAIAEVAPVSTAPETLGLAGVSMGALVGLELMWRFPERFGAYCGIQIAIKRSQAERYAWLLQRAFGRVGNGRGRPVCVVTSTRDTYRWSNQAFHDALRRNHVDASIELRDGGHTSRWMRQAGSLESLFWLDRTLHAAPAQSTPPSPSLSGPESVAQGWPAASDEAPSGTAEH
ncbi:MAG TPA: alpha/beta hydrolase-fold protein [Polyangiaceae bacterium]|nr:alpha/beta hydrolase-fold protein [Polyangiaceae bacterium]